MQLKKYRWSKDYESAEEELVDLFKAKSIQATQWEAEAGTNFPATSFEYDRRLWCAEGSLRIILADGSISLQPGDTLEIPANTMHEAQAGLAGFVCYEARN